MSVLKAAQTNDEAAALIAMRDVLAAKMDEAGPGIVPQINAQLVAVLRRLAELQPSRGVTLDDALARQREIRDGRAESASPTKRVAKSAG